MFLIAPSRSRPHRSASVRIAWQACANACAVSAASRASPGFHPVWAAIRLVVTAGTPAAAASCTFMGMPPAKRVGAISARVAP